MARRRERHGEGLRVERDVGERRERHVDVALEEMVELRDRRRGVRRSSVSARIPFAAAPSSPRPPRTPFRPRRRRRTRAVRRRASACRTSRRRRRPRSSREGRWPRHARPPSKGGSRVARCAAGSPRRRARPRSAAHGRAPGRTGQRPPRGTPCRLEQGGSARANRAQRVDRRVTRPQRRYANVLIPLASARTRVWEVGCELLDILVVGGSLPAYRLRPGRSADTGTPCSSIRSSGTPLPGEGRHLLRVLVDDAERRRFRADRPCDLFDEDRGDVAGRERAGQAGPKRLEPLGAAAVTSSSSKPGLRSSATAPCWKIALAMARVPESSDVGAPVDEAHAPSVRVPA